VEPTNVYMDFGDGDFELHLKNPCFHAAIDIAANYGMPVMPVNGKVPVMLGWPKFASQKPADIAHLFASNPFAKNVGIVTGGEYFVVDIDAKNDGYASLAALEAAHGKLPDTLTSKTGGGGLHLFFKKPAGHKTRIVTAACVLGLGVDIRGDQNGFVVCPPSVHADTGRTYEWIEYPKEIAIAPAWLMSALAGAELKVNRYVSSIKAKGCGFVGKISNSEATPLLIRMSAMVKKRYGFDGERLVQEMHRWAQAVTENPEHYTMDYVAKKCAWAIKMVEVEEIEAEVADDTAFEERDADTADSAYQTHLDLTAGGVPKKTIKNACTILDTAPLWWNGFTYDRFNRRCSVSRDIGEGLNKGDVVDDAMIIEVRRMVNVETGEDLGSTLIHEAMTHASHRRPSHPVLEYLQSLKWDETPRVNNWLTTYMGAEATPLTRAIASAWMISAVARIMRPGCEVDGALILEGRQGLGKNAAIAALLPDPEWHAELAGALDKPDTRIQLSGKWIVEMSEMKNVKRSEVEEIKSFLTATSDTYRAPYDRTFGTHARQNVFIGSSNSSAYLKDDSGNRRFWPIYCQPVVRDKWIDRDALIRDRDQLWAEAYHKYAAGESWKIEDTELGVLLEEAQEARRIRDPWELAIAFFLVDLTETTTLEILGAMEKPLAQMHSGDTIRVNAIMRRLKWEQTRPRIDGVKTRVWRPLPA
jgi:predicted P-loop ATPase